MKIQDVREIETARVPSELVGSTFFSVVSLPRTDYKINEDLRVHHDTYFLRTGESRQRIVADAQKEFESYGFSKGRFDPNWLSGRFSFKPDNCTLEADKDTVKGFNFWVAEGLIGELIRERKLPFPKIRTNREKTLKLYRNVFHDLTDVRLADEGLVDMLTAQSEPCSLVMPPTFLDKYQAGQAASGRFPGEIRIMNYGQIWDEFSTFFEDPDSGEWYKMPNTEIKMERKRLFGQKEPKRVPPKVRTISKDKGFTFREMDKVPIGRGFLYFDGSMQDVFKILADSGVKVNI